jgi:hypothetical protein
MLARLLFGGVWLMIAAGVLLPLYPIDEAMPALTSGPVSLAEVAGAGCAGCPAAAASGTDCASACACHGRRRGVGAAAAPVCLSLRVLVDHPGPARPPAQPGSLPTRLPAI